jgi:hypothetical protein
MKKLMVLGLAVLGLSFYACGGGSSKKAQNPNDAAEQFANPTGKLTSSNSKSVAQASVESKNANGIAGSAVMLSKNQGSTFDNKYAPNTVLTQAEIEACTSTSGDASSGNATVDWACLAEAMDEDPACVGTGKTKMTYYTEDEYYVMNYDNFSLNCTGDAANTVTCNGSSSYSLSSANMGVYCSNLTCEHDEYTATFNGCVNLQGHMLIFVDDESYVLEEASTDSTCNTLTVTVRDSGNTQVVNCTVTSAADNCSTLAGIETIGSCTIE